jgi:hypothetical protein
LLSAENVSVLQWNKGSQLFRWEEGTIWVWWLLAAGIRQMSLEDYASISTSVDSLVIHTGVRLEINVSQAILKAFVNVCGDRITSIVSANRCRLHNHFHLGLSLIKPGMQQQLADVVEPVGIALELLILQRGDNLLKFCAGQIGPSKATLST